MVQIVSQRKYIQDFLDFCSSFLLTEDVSLDEFMLVKSNLELLLKRMQSYSASTNLKGIVGAEADRLSKE